MARAVCDALAEFPNINASVGEDQLTVHHYVNLGIAVDLDQRGLIVPVIKDAEGKRLRQLSREIRDLAERARNKKLTPDDVTGGTFTITNPGPYGTLISAPIINQPQVAILSTDGVKKRPVVVETPAGDSIAIHPVGMIGHELGPPGHRRRLRLEVPPHDPGDHRDPRLGGGAGVTAALRARWLGRVPYREALALQRALQAGVGTRGPGVTRDDYLLLLEHPHVYTLGRQCRHRAPAGARRPMSAPTSNPPTGAATSPTTARASSSATRS